MAKKIYAVRKGLKTGLFYSWEECQKVIKGYSNAEYKSFASKEEAEAFLAVGASEVQAGSKSGEEAVKILPRNPEEVIAYVDGSYAHKLKKYSFGCVILTYDGNVIKECGNGDNKESLALRNVTGEMLGAMYAVKWAMANGYKAIEIRYDYAGIEKWVNGAWEAKNELTKKYKTAMNQWKKEIDIRFLKVMAHTNDYYNDQADLLAKKALTEADGIPKISREKTEY